VFDAPIFWNVFSKTFVKLNSCSAVFAFLCTDYFDVEGFIGEKCLNQESFTNPAASIDCHELRARRIRIPVEE